MSWKLDLNNPNPEIRAKEDFDRIETNRLVLICKKCGNVSYTLEYAVIHEEEYKHHTFKLAGTNKELSIG